MKCLLPQTSENRTQVSFPSSLHPYSTASLWSYLLQQMPFAFTHYTQNFWLLLNHRRLQGQGWDKCQELIDLFIILLTFAAARSRDIQNLLHTQSPTNPAAFCNYPSGTAVTLNQFDNIASTPPHCFEAPFYVCHCSLSERACCKASKQANTTAQGKALLPKILHFIPAGAMGD